MVHLTRLHYLDSHPTGAGGHLLSFRPDSALRFTAGQHGLWLVPGGGAKPFSMASAPADEQIELGTVLHDASRAKTALGALSPGDTVRFLGPLGRLAPPDDGRPIVLVAQGIGITPARSILRQPSTVHRTLVHVGAHHFAEETSALADRAFYPEGRQEFADQLTQSAAQQPTAHFLLAGTRAFVRDTAGQLREAGVRAQQIRRDPFYGATEPPSSPTVASSSESWSPPTDAQGWSP